MIIKITAGVSTTTNHYPITCLCKWSIYFNMNKYRLFLSNLVSAISSNSLFIIHYLSFLFLQSVDLFLKLTNIVYFYPIQLLFIISSCWEVFSVVTKCRANIIIYFTHVFQGSISWYCRSFNWAWKTIRNKTNKRFFLKHVFHTMSILHDCMIVCNIFRIIAVPCRSLLNVLKV